MIEPLIVSIRPEAPENDAIECDNVAVHLHWWCAECTRACTSACTAPTRHARHSCVPPTCELTPPFRARAQETHLDTAILSNPT